MREFLSGGMNAIHTKEPLLTSHLQSPLGHRQDRLNKPGSETPIVQKASISNRLLSPQGFAKEKVWLEEAWDCGGCEKRWKNNVL